MRSWPQGFGEPAANAEPELGGFQRRILNRPGQGSEEACGNASDPSSAFGSPCRRYDFESPETTS